MNDLDKLHMELFRNSGPHEPYPGFAKVKKGSRLPRGVDPKNLITVPELTASELIAQTQKKFNFTHLSPILAKWGFVTDEAGKTYDAMVWAPGRNVRTDDVRKHFPKGFTGNTAAFVALMAEKNPMGRHASIPEDDRLFPSGDGLCAPSFQCDDGDRYLLMSLVVISWEGPYSFWAFREI